MAKENNRFSRAQKILVVGFWSALVGSFGASQTATQTGSAGFAAEIGRGDRSAAYRQIDNIEGSYVNLATFPVRPMMVGPDGELWAINHHDSKVVRFDPPSTTATETYGVPWQPVSIAHWYNDTDAKNPNDEILVVCRGSWCVVRLDMSTGDILGVIQLRQKKMFGNNGLGRMAEPGDILVDPERDVAFVSCAGADSVIQLDLAAGIVERIYHDNGDNYDFRCKSPLFLSFDKSVPSNWKVLVAPLHSGNNTSADTALNPTPPASGNRVIDLTDTSLIDVPLPDEDLFVIDPDTNTVTPLFKELGTILFAHGFNPATLSFWILNTEANNAPPNPQNEPEIKGIFADNRVTFVTDPFGTPTTTSKLLDFSDSAGVVVGQPYGLTFAELAGPHFGRGFVTGLLTDNVTVLESSGVHYKTWDLPAGSIPRMVLLGSSGDSIDDIAFVYCWGTNVIKSYGWDDMATPPELDTYDLGHDPTPESVRDGRELFYDSSFSMDEDLSCASCHIEGGADFTVWNLEAVTQDDKGPMVTQTLVGLERLEPYHWRGERSLLDFNPAFVGLLGAKRELTPAEFADFEDFLFSLSNPANPNQNRRRFVDSTIHFDEDFALFNAVIGQERFMSQKDPIFNGAHSCNACHAVPTGTINDINRDAPGNRRPSRTRLTPTPFHEIWRKQQPRVTIEYAGGGTRESALLGAGTSHGGVIPDLPGFVRMVNGTSTLEAGQVANFVHQWDQGLAPAVHYAYYLTASNAVVEAESELQGYLLNQATARSCDMAVIARVDDGMGGYATRRWFWDKTDASFGNFPGAFRCEDPSFTPRSIRDFRDGALNFGEWALFLGLPVGMSQRFAVDYDMDGVFNLDPLEFDPYDSTVPGALDMDAPDFVPGGGPTVMWTTTRVARVYFDTDEETTADVRYREQGTPTWTDLETLPLARTHSLILRNLRPSTAVNSNGPPGSTDIQVLSEDVIYDVEVTITDNATPGNTKFAQFTVTTAPFIDPDFGAITPYQPNSLLSNYQAGHRLVNETHIVNSISMAPLSFPLGMPGTAAAAVTAEVTFKRGLPGTGSKSRIVVGRVLRQKCSAMDDCDNIEVAPSADWIAGLNAVKVDRVFIGTRNDHLALPATDVQLNKAGPLDGPYLVAILPTGPDGLATIDFELTGMDAFDHAIFDVDAVIETTREDLYAMNIAAILLGTTSDLYVRTEGSRSLDGWSFPDTGEANSTAKSEAFP